MIFAVSLYHRFSEIDLGCIVTNCLDLQRYEVQRQWRLAPAQRILATSLALLASTLLCLPTSARLGSQQLLSVSHPPPRRLLCLRLPCSHRPRKVCGAGYAHLSTRYHCIFHQFVPFGVDLFKRTILYRKHIVPSKYSIE